MTVPRDYRFSTERLIVNKWHKNINSTGTWTTLGQIRKLDEIIGTSNDVSLRFVSDETVPGIPWREAAIGFRNNHPDQN